MGNAPRTGAITEHRQEPIPQSSYHARLENDEDEQGIDSKDLDLDLEGGMKMDGGEGREDRVADLTHSVRFWSDYSRVYYHPRGLHRVPDPAEWERGVGWAQGVEKFALYDAVRTFFIAFRSVCHMRGVRRD